MPIMTHLIDVHRETELTPSATLLERGWFSSHLWTFVGAIFAGLLFLAFAIW